MPWPPKSFARAGRPPYICGMAKGAPALDDFMPGGRHAAGGVGDPRVPLLGLSRAALGAEIEALGEKRFRADQLFSWIHARGATGFDEMTDISKPLRARLAEAYRIGRPRIVTAQISSDGTRKWLLRLDDGQEVETVFIRTTTAARCASPARSAAR